ncbi:MAG TPA: glycosyltransferase, partial [Chloroflexota bacterium]|nr:glycosyltransferase [Chloroflexota bacterium]
MIKRADRYKKSRQKARGSNPRTTRRSASGGVPETASVRQDAAEPPAPRLAPAVPAVIWTGPVFDPSGYASAVRGYAHALHAAGVPTRLEDLHWNARDAQLPPDETSFLQELMVTEGRLSEPYVHVWHAFPEYFRIDPHALANVGRTVFETDRLPQAWAEACNRMDHIWVPTDFSVEAFARSGVPEHKLRTLPECLDPQRFGPDVEPVDLSTGRSFNFLSIFEWIPRKGWDVLVRAFIEEFREDEDVALVLQVFSVMGKSLQHMHNDIQACIAAAGVQNVPPIRLNTAFIAEGDVPRLYRSASAYVLPHRGEGWGRTLMEAMASGLPTIGTRWSAPLAFMSDRSSYLVDCQVVDVPPDRIREQPYYGGHRWAEPSVEHLRAQMRDVFTHHFEAKMRGLLGAADIIARFNPATVGNRIAELSAEAAELGRGRLFAQQPSAGNGPPLLWTGLIYDPSGYASELRHFSRACQASGLPIRLEELAKPKADAGVDNDERARLEALTRTELPAGEPYVHVWHFFPRYFERDLNALANVGRTMYETDRLPEEWVAGCRLMDRVWVPSEFNVETFSRSGVPRENIRVLPGCLDTSHFGPHVAPADLGTGRGFNFLSIFEWSPRKAWDVMVRAFIEEFHA